MPSVRYESLMMIPGPISKMSCNNLQIFSYWFYYHFLHKCFRKLATQLVLLKEVIYNLTAVLIFIPKSPNLHPRNLIYCISIAGVLDLLKFLKSITSLSTVIILMTILCHKTFYENIFYYQYHTTFNQML